MKNSIQKKQVAWRKDPNQGKVLVWSDINAYLEEDLKPGPKCPIYTF